MIGCFADTSFFLALLSPDDEAHEAAETANRNLPGLVVTTTWVLTEVADALAHPRHRELFLELLSTLRGDPNVTVVPPSFDLFDRAVDLYGSRRDKKWSLTDCVSFVVMKERQIHDALTADRHFEQAGFVALLR